MATTTRNLINGIDATINWLKSAINDSAAYVRAREEEHNRKFPEDRGSAFGRNLYTRVAENHDIYMSQVIQNLLYIKNVLKTKPTDINPILTNAPIAIEGLQHILEKTDRGLGMTKSGLDLRYHQIENAIINYKAVLKDAERLRVEPDTSIPKGYTGWERRAEGMWIKNMPNYELVVQQFLNKFYATVKDISAHRVHSDSTPYDTLQEAMGAAVHTAAKLANTSAIESVNRKYAEREAQRQQAQNEYKPIFRGKQGRLF